MSGVSGGDGGRNTKKLVSGSCIPRRSKEIHPNPKILTLVGARPDPPGPAVFGSPSKSYTRTH